MMEELNALLDQTSRQLREIAAAVGTPVSEEDGILDIVEALQARLMGPDVQRATYELEVDEQGRRFWSSTIAGEPQLLPPGSELRFFSEPPADGKVDGEVIDGLRHPLGTRVILEIPTGARARELEAASLARSLRQGLIVAAAQQGQTLSGPAADRILSAALRRRLDPSTPSGD